MIRSKTALFLLGAIVIAAALAIRLVRQRQSHETADRLVLSGDSLSESGRPMEALAAYRKAVRADLGDAAAREGLADQLDAMGKTTDAIAALEEGVHVSPKDRARYHYDISSTYAVHQQWARALPAARAAVAAAPSDMVYHHWMVWVLEHLKLDDEARREWADILRTHPNDAIAKRGLLRLDRKKRVSPPRAGRTGTGSE